MKTGFLIDLDNTLYSYLDCHKHSLDQLDSTYFGNLPKPLHTSFDSVAAKMVQSHRSSTIARNRTLIFKNTFESLGINNPSLLSKIEDEYWELFFGNMKLFEGVPAFLEKAKENGKTCLLTNFELSIQLKKLQRLEILNYFDAFISSQDLGVEKPDPEIFELAMSKTETSPDNSLMIGDNFDKDVDGASRIGIQSYVPSWSYNGSPKGDFTYFDSFESLTIQIFGDPH